MTKNMPEHKAEVKAADDPLQERKNTRPRLAEPLSQHPLGTLKLGKSLQENILTLLVHSDEHGQEIINLLANASFFEGMYSLVANRAMSYWKKERRAPAGHMPDLMDDILHDPKNSRSTPLMETILRGMADLFPKMNTAFAMNGLREFYGKQKDKKTLIKAAELASREDTTHEEITELLREHLRTVDAAPKGFTWEAPDYSLLDDRRGDLPEFPLDAITSERLQRWLVRAAKGTATSVAHVGLPLLGVASALIGNARRVKATRSYGVPMTLWVAVVGKSGSGKTPGMDAVRNPLAILDIEREDENAELERELALRSATAKAAHAAWLASVKQAHDNKQTPPPKPPEAKEPTPFVEPRLYVSNGTIERLGQLLQVRPQGLLYLTDELADLFSSMKRYSGNGQDNQFWLMAYDGRPFTVERVGRPSLKIKSLLVGVTGGFQPDKLDVFKGPCDGMYARWLFGWPEKPAYRPLTQGFEEVDREMKGILDKLSRLGDVDASKERTLAKVRALADHATTPEHEAEAARGALQRAERRDVPLSKQALKAFEEMRREAGKMVRLLEGREGEWWAKAEGHTLRLAGTLAFLYWAAEGGDEPTTILEEDVRAAMRLVCEYFWPHAQACLRQIGLSQSHTYARRVLRWLINKGAEQVRLEDVRVEALARRLTADETRGVLDSLSKAGWVRDASVKTGNAGRPKSTWEVNPELLAMAVDYSEEEEE